MDLNLSNSEWATWIGSISTLLAVVVALIAIFVQNRLAIRAEAQNRATDEAMTLLSLSYLAGELRRMIILSGYQVDQTGNQVIYPDIAEEFAAIRAMLEQLSVERIAARGCIQEWHLLRRIASEMRSIYSAAPSQSSGFYLQHRNRFDELHKQAMHSSLEIQAWLEEFAPDLYGKHKLALDTL